MSEEVQDGSEIASALRATLATHELGGDTRNVVDALFYIGHGLHRLAELEEQLADDEEEKDMANLDFIYDVNVHVYNARVTAALTPRQRSIVDRFLLHALLGETSCEHVDSILDDAISAALIEEPVADAAAKQ